MELQHKRERNKVSDNQSTKQGLNTLKNGMNSTYLEYQMLVI